MRARPILAAVALIVALTPGWATAAEPDPAIVGGEPSKTCEWPSVVALRTGGLCTATLVHPRVIVYAAHCGTLHTHALFGEDVDAPAREVPLLRCERYSDLFAVSSMDYAWCELAEPVEDVAITPLLFGCDEALIEIGTPVTIVGFGDTSSDGPEQTGIKHAAQAQIVGYLSTVGIGGMGVGADSGDSGGPALVQLEDGSWRVLGIVSGGGGDGATVQYVPAPKTAAWIEDRSGIDITPCHASDGSWAPTPACEGMFVSVDASASWADGCPGPVAPPSQDCGAPWTEIADTQAPSVSVVEPIDGTTLDGAPVEIDVLGEAQDLGVGIAELRLSIDGQPWIDGLGRAAVDQVPPYRFEGVALELDGAHTITLEAVDHFGNASTASATIMLGEPSSDDTGESGESGESGDTSEETPADPAGDSSCACTSEHPRDPAAPLLLLSALALRSRRRPRAAIHRPRGCETRCD
ncbi:MAG TPA: trypsin-like serine protease, partial [Enhygromyxa sp.]|nr:trypsin-like serine protease [Enhygromyxa sp.]